MDQRPYEKTFLDKWVFPALYILAALIVVATFVLVWAYQDFSMA